MKFENPKMNVSMFDMESVVTESATGKAMDAIANDTEIQEALGTNDPNYKQTLQFVF